MVALKPALSAASLALAASSLGAAGYDGTRLAALDALEAGDCARVWGLLWPEAAGGNATARGDIADLAITRGLRLPGPVQDDLTFVRDALVFAAHGLPSGEGAAYDIALSLARNLDWASPKLGAFAQCLETASGPSEAAAQCLEPALASGAIPGFDQITARVTALANAPEARPAHCGHWPGSPPGGE